MLLLALHDRPSQDAAVVLLEALSARGAREQRLVEVCGFLIKILDFFLFFSLGVVGFSPSVWRCFGATVGLWKCGKQG